MQDILINLLNKIPSLPSLPDLTVYKDFIINIINGASYFLPLGTLLLIISLDLAISNFNFIYKIITKVWETIPFN